MDVVIRPPQTLSDFGRQIISPRPKSLPVVELLTFRIKYSVTGTRFNFLNFTAQVKVDRSETRTVWAWC